MFCPGCGSELLAESAYCHKCGKPISLMIHADAASQVSASAKSQVESEQELRAKIRQGAPDLEHCQICSSSAEVTFIDFGLGKLATRRRWAEAGVSLLTSAIFLPLFGIGKFALPTKASNLKVVRLRLVLCARCVSHTPDYAAHPWFQELWNAGFDQFIPPERLGLYYK
ncbi:MAG TPA: hypothetical protein VME86_15220 [Acidobacteriaceae bacterium]|nr:hypothetical protein [Acidobacteriaceae bacterium]